MVVDEDQDFSDLKEIEVLKVGLHDEKWPTWAQKYTEESLPRSLSHTWKAAYNLSQTWIT